MIDQRLSTHPDVRCMVSTDGAVLMDLRGGKYFSLNTVGARIWTKAQEGLSLAEILADLEESFPVAPEQLKTDLDRFVSGLEKKGLVHVGSA